MQRSALWSPGLAGLLSILAYSLPSSSALAQTTASSSVAADSPATAPAPATLPASGPSPTATPPPVEAPPPPAETPPPVAAAASAEEESDGAEEIVVTGSRIPTSLDREATILNLGRSDIDRSGLTSIADLLQQLPISGGTLNTKFNSSGNFGFPPDGGGIGAGAALADLRYLGPKRVLVLVDGVRWINGSSASGVSSATDLNTIPASIIERIEILQDGASPIYGSDAIAGVVNIITRKDVQGVTANAYLGAYTEGDGVTQQYDVGWGHNDDRLSVYLNASYVRQGEVFARDRAISQFPIAGFDRCTNNCSSGTPQGRFFLTDPNTNQGLDLTINPGTGGIPSYDPNAPGGMGDDFNPFDTSDRFNFAPFNYVLTPSERVGVFSQARYKLVPEVTLFIRALYNNRRSKNQAAPEPLFIGPEAGNGNRLDTISVDVSNPFNPFGFTLDSATNPYFIGRRPLEAGAAQSSSRASIHVVRHRRTRAATSRSTRSKFYWDAGAGLLPQPGRPAQDAAAFNSAKLEKALGPLDECNADPDCVPFNIFGGQGIDSDGERGRRNHHPGDARLRRLRPERTCPSSSSSTSTPTSRAHLSFDLPAGPLSGGARLSSIAIRKASSSPTRWSSRATLPAFRPAQPAADSTSTRVTRR